MKRVFIFLTAAALVISFASCKEACERNQTGDVTVTNNTDVALWFDVAEVGDEYENENRMLNPGTSTTYAMPDGSVNIWVSETNVTADFEKFDILNVSQCETTSYSLEECAWYAEGDVTISNSASSVMRAALMVAGTGCNYCDGDGCILCDDAWISEFIDIAVGYSVTWEMVPARYMGFWIIYEGNHTGPDYTLESCEHWEYSFTGSAKKNMSAMELPKNLEELQSRPKPERQRAIDPDRVKRSNY